MYYNEQEMLPYYEEMILERLGKKFKPYLLTFMFKRFNGNSSTRRKRMEQEIIRIYSHLLTHLIRKPKQTTLTRLPFWFVCPDRPVYKKHKHKKNRLQDVIINDGPIALIPPETRSPDSFEDLLLKLEKHFVGNGRFLMSLDVAPIYQTPERVFDYTVKSIKKGRFDLSAVLILPRTHSEMSVMTKAERQYEISERKRMNYLYEITNLI